MSTPMFGPMHNFGERPGSRTSASFLKRMQEEMYAARGTSGDGPINIINGPSGAGISLDRVTLDLRRFKLTEDLLSGGAAEAQILLYDNEAPLRVGFDYREWGIFGETFTVYDSLGLADGSTKLKEGQYGFAAYFPDNGLWEVVQIGDLIGDEFFPARLDSRTLDSGTYIYDWTEMEWTSATAAATVKSGGRTGTNSPRCWPAVELNNNIIATDTIVWMKRGYKATSPAVAVVAKTASGNNAGTHAAFTLYLDQVTGGTFTLTYDGTTTAAIAYSAIGATVQTAIETAITGLTLSSFTGAGTLASPWAFSVSSDTQDHTITASAASLKGNDGYRFEMSEGSGSSTLCMDPEEITGYDAEATMNVAIWNAEGCLESTPISACTSPRVINGGTVT